ncbi:MAG: response regulator transcription factor [Bacteroidota bacterium]
MKRTILIFGGLAAILYLLFELGKFSLLRNEGTQEIFLILSGVAFVVTGFLLGGFFNKKPKRKYLKKSNLSKQELRVLQLVNEGFSNLEIAERLFISESTVKTHLTNIFSKLKAKRRTEAIKIGRELEII